MENTISLEMTQDEAEQLNSLLEECLAAMQKYRVQMDKDKLEIESSQARTWAILRELQEKGGLNVETTL